MALGIGVVLLTATPLLAPLPGSRLWWLARPLWIGGLLLMTLPFITAFRRLEGGRRALGSRPHAAAGIAVTMAAGIAYASVAAKGIPPNHPTWALVALLPMAPMWLWLGSTRVRHKRNPRTWRAANVSD